jgi:hypothetical protein
VWFFKIKVYVVLFLQKLDLVEGFPEVCLVFLAKVMQVVFEDESVCTNFRTND